MPVASRDVGGRDRFEVADLVQQVRAQQHAVGLLEQHAGVPAVRQMRRGHEAEPVATRLEPLVDAQRTRRAVREVVDVDHRADDADDRGRLGGNRQPLVERAALVHLEVAPADPPQRRRVDHFRQRLAHLREHPAHAGVEEERLLVADQEMIELQIERLGIHADAVEIRGHFVDSGHDTSSALIARSVWKCHDPAACYRAV